jgi:uncharacterized flavoprotein (TIGR03862 family)
MKVAVVGGGPAGLRAAEVAANSGASVDLFDAKASVGRKFLVAGRGGLNLTNNEPRETFITRYSGPAVPGGTWKSLIDEFDADDLRGWAAGLGVETFVASTGRVYPRELKAAPLLRRWVQRLRFIGVQFFMHHRLIDVRPGKPITMGFARLHETVQHQADAVVLALGGASWPETGSDGAWVPLFERLRVPVHGLQPANCGWEVQWPREVIVVAEGRPLKNITARAGGATASGELLVTRYGLEGGAIYEIGAALRSMAEPKLTIDFKPTLTVEQLVARLRPGGNVLADAWKTWRLSDAAWAIVTASAADRSLFTPGELARAVKECTIRLSAPRPIWEAISSAGGVRWTAIDHNLMLRDLPGVFVAGEMIDWEAPTGGYLIQGCFATGGRAGTSAVEFASRQAI